MLAPAALDVFGVLENSYKLDFLDFEFVLILFCENLFWSIRSVFEHVKFDDFQVVDFDLFYSVTAGIAQIPS